MKRYVALAVEKAWMENRLRTLEEIDTLANGLFEELSKRYPGCAGFRDRAVEEIRRDAAKTLRVLSYGGRKAASLSDARVARVREDFANFWQSAA